MGRWVTLDDGQHVYIEKGNVLAGGPPKSSDETMVLYHGTSFGNLESIHSQGLINSAFKGYSMLSTDRRTSIDAATAKGAGVVLEYHVPADAVNKHLDRGGRETGIRGETDRYFSVKPEAPLPGEYIRQVHVTKEAIDVHGLDKITTTLARIRGKNN